MEKEIDKGDVVILKSGGPLMTVYNIEKDCSANYIIIKCMWFTDGDLLYGYFRPETITKKDK